MTKCSNTIAIYTSVSSPLRRDHRSGEMSPGFFSESARIPPRIFPHLRAETLVLDFVAMLCFSACRCPLSPP